MSEQGSDAQMTVEQRAELEQQAAEAHKATAAEEQRTAEQPVTGRDGPRYAH